MQIYKKLIDYYDSFKKNRPIGPSQNNKSSTERFGRNPYFVENGWIYVELVLL